MESIENVQSDEGAVVLTVKAEKNLAGVKIGDSISVNGTCVTVTYLDDKTFSFGLAPKTLRCTNLGALLPDKRVNLERSMPADGRFGVHVVQEHVDSTGSIPEISPQKESLWFTISIPKSMIKFVVQKGYITIDGASLTFCLVNDSDCSFTFMIIAHTQANVVTALKNCWRFGER